MFTGIVTDQGVIAAIDQGRAARRFIVDAGYDPTGLTLGASVAHAGCCLTLIEVGAGPRGARWAVEASQETLDKTTLGDWSVGTRVNLERALKLGDEMGGHLVTGHVDGVGRLASQTTLEGSWVLEFAAPPELARFIAAKGSVAIDGVSLTVNGVDRDRFVVTVIPHTAEATTLGALAANDKVNLEIDLVARYIARLTEARA